MVTFFVVLITAIIVAFLAAMFAAGAIMIGGVIVAALSTVLNFLKLFRKSS